jgi:hypothetical protein
VTPDLAFNYEDLRFIELQEPGSKFPAKSWGGYSQDYDEADRVYTHEDVQIHPGDAWGVVGIDAVPHASVSLLVFDLDVHKAPDDFDPDDLSLPTNTAIVRSQSGGFHVYFMVHEPRGAGAESDFQMTESLGWDIDIRGSYVSHHVVAPADVPGVGGDYELVNDESIAGVFDPADAAERIRYQGEPLLEVDRDTGVTNFEFDRPSEAPAEMPTCYHAGLELRKAAPEDHPNTHKVNVLTALCGLAAGYDPEAVAEHFCGEWAPQDGDVDHSDVDETEYQVGHLAEKLEAGEYSPPALSTLREWGILGEHETCDCSLPYHGESDSPREPVAALPLGALDVLTGEERERLARRRGHTILSTSEAREKLRNSVFRELRAGASTVIDAPTALGKSHTVATEPWRRRADVTGEAPMIHTHATKETRDEAVEATAGSSATGEALEGRKEASPLARGDHDPPEDPDAEGAPDVVVTIDGVPASEWFDDMCDDRKLPFSTALAIARERNDQGLDDLPPIGEEDPAVEQWDGVPWTDDGEPAVDVVHATHQFLYVPSLRQYTNVVLDEQPDFKIDLSQDRIRRMVTAYLQETDAPAPTWEAFTQLAKHGGHGGDAARERDALDAQLTDEPEVPDWEWFVDDADAHALAPDLTRALWRALRWEDPDANGRRSTTVLHEPPRFESAREDGYAGNWLSVVIDEENTVRRVRLSPDFSQARAVIGLDAHPSMPMWQLNTGASVDLTTDEVLEPSERQLWRRYERGLTAVQIGDHTRPRSGSNAREWLNADRVREQCSRLREHYGAGFSTGITTAQVENRLRSLLSEAGVVDVGEESTMHYGEEKSRNDFADEKVGYVYGCMDPGDGMILDALAELGLDAEPATVETDDGEVKREKGRGFVGPDADEADAILGSVRENHVAQAAGRYARNPDDRESQAIVFVDTNASPDHFADLQVPGVEWLATETQRAIVDELAQRPQATSQDLADAVGCSREHVRQTLDRLKDGDGCVTRLSGAGEDGADVWRGDPNGALVDLGEDLQLTPKGSIRWSLEISVPRPAGDGRDRPDRRDQAVAADGGTDLRGMDPPDDPV